MKHIIKQESLGVFVSDKAITLEPGDFIDLVGSDGAVHSYYAVERPNGIPTCDDCDACSDVDCFEYSFRCHDVLLKRLESILEEL